MGDMPGSSQGTARSSMRAPRPLSLTSSGSALERPPAPTSWMERMGFLSLSCQQRTITSWQRRSISGMPRCTEAKSRSSALAPLATAEAGDAQAGHREAGEPRLGLGAAAGRAFVPDLAAGAGGRARKGRDRGRMIVGFHLDGDVAVLAYPCIFPALAGLRIKALGARAGDHR